MFHWDFSGRDPASGIAAKSVGILFRSFVIAHFVFFGLWVSVSAEQEDDTFYQVTFHQSRAVAWNADERNPTVGFKENLTWTSGILITFCAYCIFDSSMKLTFDVYRECSVRYKSCRKRLLKKSLANQTS